MKKDIFFTEITPLVYKEKLVSYDPLLSQVTFFEIIISLSLSILLPSFRDTCDVSPLTLWLSVNIILLNLHLVYRAIEQLIKNLKNTKTIWIIHCIFFIAYMAWLIIGHWWVAEAYSCLDHQDFIISASTLLILDLLFLIFSISVAFSDYSVQVIS